MNPFELHSVESIMIENLRIQLDKSLSGYSPENRPIPGEKFETAVRATFCAHDASVANSEDVMLIAFSQHSLLVHRTSMIKGWWSGPRILIPLGHLLSVNPVEQSPGLFDFILAHGKYPKLRIEIPRDEIQYFFQSLIAARANHINPDSTETLVASLSSIPGGHLGEVLEQLEHAATLEQFSPLPHLFCGQLAAAIGDQAKSVEHLIRALPAVVKLPFQVLCSLPLDPAACLYIIDSFPNIKVPEAAVLRLICGLRLGRYDDVRTALTVLRKRGKGDEQIVGISRALDLLPSEERRLIQWSGTEENLESSGKSDSLQKSQIAAALTCGGDFATLATDVMFRVDPVIRGCNVWRRLRANDFEAARTLCQTFPHLDQKILSSVCRQREDQMWLASIAVLEVAARSHSFDGMADAATSAYSHVASQCKSDCESRLFSELRYASDIRQFYSSIGERSSRLLSLYAQRLAKVDVHWPQSVVDATGLGLSFADADCDWRNMLDMFDRWTRSALLRTSRQTANGRIEDALYTFDDVFRSSRLRVIVLGETSAGKSALLNRLIGLEILPSGRSETTSVPTHIRVGEQECVRIRVSGPDRSVLLDKEFVETPDLKGIRELIHATVALESTHRKDVARVDIELVSNSSRLTRDIEIVDAPGLNAHDERTTIVVNAVARAHACIFVLDGRNALKAGEFRDMQWTQEAIARTVFVVNKCDLLEDDDELDVDHSAMESVLNRVRAVLRDASDSDDIIVVPASAATGKGIEELRSQLRSLLDRTGEEAILYAASRAAKTVANEAIDYVLQKSEGVEVALRSLMSIMPCQPSVFEVTLKAQVRDAWNSAREQYIEKVSDAVERSLKDFNRRVEERIGTYAPRGLDGLAAFARRELRPLLDDLVQRVGKNRDEEWIRLGQRTTSEAVGYFRAIYDEIDFGDGFDPEAMLESATPMPLQRRMESTLKSIDQKVSGLSTGAAMGVGMGAGIGQMLGGPWGALIGGVVGALGAAEQFEQAKKEVCELIDGQIQRGVQELTEALQGDVDGGPGQTVAPMLRAILGAIDEQRSECQAAVIERIDAVKERIAATDRELVDMREMAGAASEWAQRFDVFLQSFRRGHRG